MRSFLPFVPSNVVSIVPITSAEVPFPTYISVPTTDTSFNIGEAVPTVFNFVVSLLRTASSKLKSIYEPAKNASPAVGIFSCPRSNARREFEVTFSYLKLFCSVPLKVSI